ncbi:MAG: nucleotide exchange factor GrpE [Clostridia bacterium]|nr:nucleotide exchange factor GrpE [Clostridia bacterium]
MTDDIKDGAIEEEEPVKEEKEEKKPAKDKGEKKLKAELEKQKKEIEKLEDELAGQKDKYLRMMAEYDNFRKRAAKEKEGAYTDAYGDALTAILPVIDNLERAAAYGDSDPAKVGEGVRLTLDAFKAALERLGVEEIPAEPGGQFDPNIHNAVMHSEDGERGENEITDVFAKGYKRGDRVLRHTMVKVAN